ncbi:hypothetical protein Tco_0527212 [Tanacetum coccineum]
MSEQGKGLLGPRGRQCGGNGGRGGFMAERGGGCFAKYSINLNDRRGGGGFMVLGGCVGADGGEVSGGGDDFGSKSLIGEIPEVMIGEGGGETFGDDGGVIWLLAGFFSLFDLGIVSYLEIEYERECLEQAPFIVYLFE